MSSEWVDVKFSEVAKLTTGKLDSNAAVLKGRYPFFTCAPETSAIDSYAFDMEAVLLAGNNANANFPIKYYKGKFNAYQRTYVIDSKNPDKLRTKFLFYALESSLRELKKLSVGSATKFLTKVILENLDIKLPSIAEQDVILELLGSIDDRITLLRETNATLEAIAQALFKSWFVDFDPVHANAHTRAQQSGNSHPQAVQQNPAPHTAEAIAQNLGLDAATAALFPDHFQDADLSPIPAGWRVGSIGDVIKVKGGFAFKSADFQESGCPVIKIKNIVGDGTVDTQDVQRVSNSVAEKAQRFALGDGDIIMAMTGATIGKVGIYVQRDADIAYLNQRVAKFEPLSTAESNVWFAYVAFLFSGISDQIVNSASGSAQPNISTTGIEATRLIIPDNQKILSEFNRNVHPLFMGWIGNQKRIKILTELRDTLLPRLISGQLRLPEAEAQIEAVVGGV